MSKIAAYIDAIQVLKGNAPEQIFENRFVRIRVQFPYEKNVLQETINDIEAGVIYSEPRMMSDNHRAKISIQETAHYFASEIIKLFTPKEVLRYAKELQLTNNLPLGKMPTIKETLLLFSNQYFVSELISAVSENEKLGQYEFRNASLKYKEKSVEILRAGTHPYSPNYRAVFEGLELKETFDEFEKVCCEKSLWCGSYNYAVQAGDISEIYDLERKLLSIDEKIENHRQIVYTKLNDIYLKNEFIMGRPIKSKLLQDMQMKGITQKTENKVKNSIK